MRNFNSKQWFGVVGVCTAVSAVVYWDQSQNSTGNREGRGAKDTQNIPAQAITALPSSTINTHPGNPISQNAAPLMKGAERSAGSVPAASTSPQVATSPQAAAAPALPGCVSYRFTPEEKNLAQYPRHILKIPLKDFDKKSICVKVNGTPVKYLSSKKSPNEITLGAIMIHQPIVEIRACRIGNKCAEDCNIPKDEFMEALAGEEDLSVAQAVSQGYGDTETDKKIDREIAHFKKDLHGSDEEKGLFYQDWRMNEEKAACQTKVARNH